MAAHKVKIFTNIQNLSSLFWNLIDIHYQNVQMSKVPFFLTPPLYIPYICQFWFTSALFMPVKSTPNIA